MSELEILQRANYLIYMYIKKTLKSDGLAENFQKVIQEDGKKEFIYFKGLEDLTLLLKKYYSSQTSTSDQHNGMACHVPEDESAVNEKIQAADADFVLDNTEKSKKKRLKQPKSKEMFGLETKAESETPDIEESNDAERLQQENFNSDRTEKKKRRKKSHMELDAGAECGAQPQENAPLSINGSGEIAAPAATEEAESEKAPKKKRKKKRHLEAEPEVECGVDETSVGATQDANCSAGIAIAAAATEVEESEVAPKKKRKKNKAAGDAELSGKVGDACRVAQSNEEAKQHPSADVDLDASTDYGASGGNGKPASNQQKRHNQPFRRVREEEVVNKHFQDNSFDAKPGSATGWGYKANEDLKPTQGRSFRHEKTKKKRGSYKGGSIDTGVSSFKFDSDSE